MIMYITYEGDEHEYEVEGTWIPPQRARMYLKNGDPGHPAEGGYYEDVEVFEDGVDVTELLPWAVLEKISVALAEEGCPEQEDYRE